QHAPYLAATLKKEPKFELVEAFKTVNFPMAIYSTKYKKVEDIPAGATIGIPNDPSNGARALLVLADKGFIEVKDKNDVSTSVASITKNPKNYKIQELDAASIPKAMGDLDIAVINANYALVAKLNPSKDSLLVERADNPFVNIFVTTKANEKDPRMEQLKKIYTSAENKKFIEDHFKGSITPAF
ncbi:MetQ/NlpA family ABC transporter substrate-binding protein, partial [Phascolarctobacterium succinatutens]